LEALLKRLIPVEREEWRSVLLATGYGVAIFLSYYILRPVRDEISTVERGNLQILWTAVFIVMLIAVPLYSWLVSRTSRAVFIPIANRFFALNILAFFAAIYLMPESSRVWIDRLFYVWISVFALFVVTVYWGFVADLFHNDQGKRAFGFIAAGSSVGAALGSGVTALLAERIPVFMLLLIAVVPLEIAAFLAGRMHRGAEASSVLRREGRSRVPGNAFSGIQTVLRSPYLAKIAGFIFLMTFASTVLYYHQSELVYAAIPNDRGQRTALLAQMNLAVSILTLGGQAFITAHLIRRIGVGLALALVPALTLVGFLVLGLNPMLVVFIIVQVAYSTLHYAIAKPSREVLFTVVSREERYKSKAFVDAAVYRGGDLVNGWIYAGLAALGMGVGGISLLAVPIMALWAWWSFSLGRDQEVLAGRVAEEEGVVVGEAVRV
jgi:AAA family ATP:ADP antiporter